METFLIVAGVIASIIVYLVAAWEFGNIAGKKGFDKNKYLFYSLILPVAGWLMVVALPDKTVYSEVKNTNKYLDYILRNGVNVYICEDEDEDAEDDD